MPHHKKSGSVDEQLGTPTSSPGHRGHTPTGSTSSISSFTSDQADLPTPAPTEGETATETEPETERETDVETDTPRSQLTPSPVGQPSRSQHHDGNSLAPPASQHDLMNSYFRKDTLFISNIDLLRYGTHVLAKRPDVRQLIVHFASRTSDLQLALLISYVSIFTLLPRELSNKAVLVLHFIHALGWCLFHSFGLGLLLQGPEQE
jgi:phosphatidylethanolamine N-methyltransferase